LHTQLHDGSLRFAFSTPCYLFMDGSALWFYGSVSARFGVLRTIFRFIPLLPLSLAFRTATRAHRTFLYIHHTFPHTYVCTTLPYIARFPQLLYLTLLLVRSVCRCYAILPPFSTATLFTGCVYRCYYRLPLVCAVTRLIWFTHHCWFTGSVCYPLLIFLVAHAFAAHLATRYLLILIYHLPVD